MGTGDDLKGVLREFLVVAIRMRTKVAGTETYLGALKCIELLMFYIWHLKTSHLCSLKPDENSP